MKKLKFSAVIVANGTSQRYGDSNKLTEMFLDKTVLQHSLDAFFGLVDEIIVVGNFNINGVKCVEGGNTRFQSVLNGLSAVSNDCDVVAVHDGARPFVSRRLVADLLNNALVYDSAVPSLPLTDTVWQRKDDGISLIDRNALLGVQTPQCFKYSMLMQAVASAKYDNYPDESTLFYETFGNVNFVGGEVSNRKITFAGDIPDYKVGVGFDVHAFGEGRGVILGGVTIPFDKKLIGHSDADVLAHAICDAVLSASNNKDIGHQFPDTDDTYKGADSLKLLRRCVALANGSNYEVVNVSAVVICQQPKIAPYIDKMAVNLAAVLNIPQSCVNLTATTTEHLGALGNGDGIAVQAQALLKRIDWR